MTREEVFQYAAARYGTEPAYLWRKYPRYAVLRHDQGKWYGLVVNVSAKTLGLDATDAEQDVLVVKGNPEEIAILQQSRGFLPAYHMNKRHWITVLLTDPQAARQVPSLLAESFALTSD